MRSSRSSGGWVTRDYYDILGLDRQVTKSEMKRAYRKLAFRYHPDRNPGDVEAEARFQEVMEAYGVLSNPIRRWHYDHRSEHFNTPPEDDWRGQASSSWARYRPLWVGLAIGLFGLIGLGSYLALRPEGQTSQAASFQDVVSRADSLFDASDYRGAVQLYAQARDLRPAEEHVRVRFDESMGRLTSSSIRRSREALLRGDSLLFEADRLRLSLETQGGDALSAAELYAEANEVYLEGLRSNPGDSLLARKVQLATEHMREVLAAERAQTGQSGRSQTSGGGQTPDLAGQLTDVSARIGVGLEEARPESVQQLLFMVHSQQGDLLMVEGKLLEARAKYQEALTYRADDSYIQDRLQQIEETLEIASREEPEETRRALGGPMLGAGVMLKPRLGSARSDVSNDEWQYRYFRTQGDRAAKRSNYQVALSSYKRALAFKPDDEYVEQQVQAVQALLSRAEGGEPSIVDGAYLYATEPPEPIGGINQLYRRVRYPATAQQSGITGWVFARFIVDAEGHVRSPRVLRGIGHGCDEEVLRVVSRARFKPGQYKGEPVAAWVTLPFVFGEDSGNPSASN